MSTTAISMVRDEADVIGHTIGRMLEQVDHIIVADNGSTDGTREILDELPITVIDDAEVAYYQSRKMSELARLAREVGGDWIVPFDADERWVGRDKPITEVLAQQPEWMLVVEATLYDHVATAEDDPNDEDPLRRMLWRRAEPAPLPKVAVRAVEGLVIHQGNHGASFPDTDQPPTVRNLLSIRHFPYRSAEQFIRKARNGAEAYAATDLPDDAGAHWRSYGRIFEEIGEEGLADVFRKWFSRDDPRAAVTIDGERQAPLVFDPCP